MDSKCDKIEEIVEADNVIPESNNAKMGQSCVTDNGCGNANGRSGGSFTGIFSLF